MINFFSDGIDGEGQMPQNTNAASSTIFRPGYSSEEKKCAICSKVEKSTGPVFLFRYGGFVCSRECYAAKRVQAKRVSVNKDDVQILKDVLELRKELIESIKDNTKKMDSIRQMMYVKNIPLSYAFYKNTYIFLRAQTEYGLPQIYTWGAAKPKDPSNPEKEIEPIYIMHFMKCMERREVDEGKVKELDKWLTSGKCLRYSIK